MRAQQVDQQRCGGFAAEGDDDEGREQQSYGLAPGDVTSPKVSNRASLTSHASLRPAKIRVGTAHRSAYSTSRAAASEVLRTAAAGSMGCTIGRDLSPLTAPSTTCNNEPCGPQRLPLIAARSLHPKLISRSGTLATQFKGAGQVDQQRYGGKRAAGDELTGGESGVE